MVYSAHVRTEQCTLRASAPVSGARPSSCAPLLLCLVKFRVALLVVLPLQHNAEAFSIC